MLAQLKEKRRVGPSANFMKQLKVWGEVGCEIWEDVERNIPKETYGRYLDGRAVRWKEWGLTRDESILTTPL